jgi:hypothetical protein
MGPNKKRMDCFPRLCQGSQLQIYENDASKRSESLAIMISSLTPWQKKEKNMAQENKSGASAPAGLAGLFWFAGWLFTISFANLVWWKIILAIVVWPYYLGQIVS